MLLKSILIREDSLPKRFTGKSDAGAFSVKLTAEDIAFLEEPYVPHRIVGAIDSNPPQGTKLLDEKK